MEIKEDVLASITGTSVEMDERIKSDEFLLKNLDNEIVDRMETDKDIINSIDDVREKYSIISKQLLKHEIALNFVIGLSVFLLVSIILIAFKMQN